MRDLSMEKVLNSKLEDGTTVKVYLRMLLLGIWTQEESFSSKRPFGNSGWKSEVIRAVAGIEELTDEEWDHCDKLVTAAIRYMCI